jgi:hypothetical protein
VVGGSSQNDASGQHGKNEEAGLQYWLRHGPWVRRRIRVSYQPLKTVLEGRDVGQYMDESRNSSELRLMWGRLMDAFAKPNRPVYPEFIQLQNEMARSNGKHTNFEQKEIVTHHRLWIYFLKKQVLRLEQRIFYSTTTARTLKRSVYPCGTKFSHCTPNYKTLSGIIWCRSFLTNPSLRAATSLYTSLVSKQGIQSWTNVCAALAFRWNIRSFLAASF